MAEESALMIDTGEAEVHDSGNGGSANLPPVGTSPVDEAPHANVPTQTGGAETVHGQGNLGSEGEAIAKTKALNSDTPEQMDARSPDSIGAGMRENSASKAVQLNSIRNIKVKVEAILGGVSMPVSQLAEIKHGEIIRLERQIGEMIEVTANGQLIARGEIVVIEDEPPKFGISLTEII